MSKKLRLIARLDVKDDHLVKGIQYEGLRKLGDPHDFARRYYEQGVDELLYLDTVASLYERNNLGDILRRTTADVFIPITAGGGLRSAEDVGAVLKAGADKAAVNTAALRRPQLITEIARAYGSQCVVVSIQAKRRDPARPEAGWEAYYDNGREHSGRDVLEWARQAAALGVGQARQIGEQRREVPHHDIGLETAHPGAGGRERHRGLPEAVEDGHGVRPAAPADDVDAQVGLERRQGDVRPNIVHPVEVHPLERVLGIASLGDRPYKPAAERDRLPDAQNLLRPVVRPERDAPISRDYLERGGHDITP